VGPRIGLTFAAGLRHIVRQDPDVIMVGEIPDLETAETSIQAALTGHLVFSTLHTNDAPDAIARLQDMGAESYLVASVLNGVLASVLYGAFAPPAARRTRRTSAISSLSALPTPRAWSSSAARVARTAAARATVGASASASSS
jgi:type II secretory ATPase GspE/PulE/Tfp pilus assembly ATPase PilB-like protein